MRQDKSRVRVGVWHNNHLQGLQQSYSQYFNLKHHKSGHLFEGRYETIICQKDEYLPELIRYSHLNPVRAGMVKTLERYRYSGHHAYLQARPLKR